MRRWACSRRGMLGLAALSAVAAAGVAAPVVAEAGTYTVHSCELPGGDSAGLDGWTWYSTGSESANVNHCGRGNDWPDNQWKMFFRPGSRPSPGDKNFATFTAPPYTAIGEYTLWRSARVKPAPSYDYSYEFFESNMTMPLERCSGIAGCATIGKAQDPFSESNVIWRSGLEGVFRVRMSIGCRGTATCGMPSTDNSVKMYLHRAEITLVDESRPVLIEKPRGSLLADGALDEVRTATISAQDLGGGVRDAIAEIDGHEIASSTLDSNDGRCRPPYTSVVPCRSQATGTLAVNTWKVPNGEHELVLRVTDATGTNSAAWGPLPVRIANACPMRPRANAGRVTAWLSRGRGAANRKRSLTIRHGRRATVHARVRGPGGAPLAGGTVCVATRVARPHANPRIVARKRLSPRGRVSARIPPGPSRNVYVVSPRGGAAVVGKARLRVHTGVKLHASRHSLRNGDVVILRGNVARPIPPRGALVELQARRGAGWQTFGTTRARGPKARYKFRYRFTRTTGVQRYSLRARVPDQPAYPYAPGASRPVVVTVRG
jgi:hypothetical protein